MRVYILKKQYSVEKKCKHDFVKNFCKKILLKAGYPAPTGYPAGYSAGYPVSSFLSSRKSGKISPGAFLICLLIAGGRAVG